MSCTIFLLLLLPFKKKTEQSKWIVQGRGRTEKEEMGKEKKNNSESRRWRGKQQRDWRMGRKPEKE